MFFVIDHTFDVLQFRFDLIRIVDVSHRFERPFRLFHSIMVDQVMRRFRSEGQKHEEENGGKTREYDVQLHYGQIRADQIRDQIAEGPETVERRTDHTSVRVLSQFRHVHRHQGVSGALRQSANQPGKIEEIYGPGEGQSQEGDQMRNGDAQQTDLTAEFLRYEDVEQRSDHGSDVYEGTDPSVFVGSNGPSQGIARVVRIQFGKDGGGPSHRGVACHGQEIHWN